jgi:MFS transporter
VALYATLAHVAESRDESASSHFDWFGASVVFLAVGGLSFGAIIGQQENWHGVLAYAALAIGGLAAIAFPFLMKRSRHPLVPLELFRSRNFTVTNISTLLIYGALYVTFAFVTIYLIGTLGYNPAAAGLVGIPSSLLLALFSTRFGKLAARYGPRFFMSVGPALMGLGVLWFARLPASSHPWVFELRHLSTWVPPSTYWKDLLPGYLIFGAGLTMMVAPLTTALMTSVPKQNSGVGSAVNNAISRVGPQLAGALIFVAIATSFYHGVASRVPGTDTSSSDFRTKVAPLNEPDASVSEEVKRAAREASGQAFHIGMYVAAGLLFAGAAVNAAGIKNPQGPAWMRSPKGMESQAIPRLGPERPAGHGPVPAEQQHAPPWMDKDA